MHHTPPKRKKITDLSGRNLNKFESDDGMIDSTSLILDNNKISEFCDLISYTSLEKLSVANNGLTRMNQFEALLNLKVLDLKDNHIKAIEGLSSLLHLEWLCLAGNNIKVIGNLKSNTLLRYLDLSDNWIEELSDLSFLIHLKTVLIHTNRISTLKTVASCFPPSVHTLTMAENKLSDLTEVQLLANLPFLEDLTLFGNPLSCSHNGQYLDYRLYAICCCKNLQTLDGTWISKADKHSADVFEAEGHLKMLQPGQHSQLASFLLEASPEYSPTIPRKSQVKKSREKSQSPGVNTSLLESESIHIPVTFDSPPKSRDPSMRGTRPLTAPPTYAAYRTIPWQTLMSENAQSLTLERDISKVYDRENGILTPLPSESSPGGSVECDRTMRHVEGHGIPQGAIEITSEVAEKNDRFRARVHVQEVRRPKTGSPAYQSQGRRENERMVDKEVELIRRKELAPGNFQTSVSLTADEAANILHLAAAMIQAYVRGFLQRRRYQMYLVRHRAATKIQAAWRGYLARNYDLRMISIRYELKVQRLNSKIESLESKVNRSRTERKKDKAVVVDAMKVLVEEISLQREKLNQIEMARQKEVDAKNELRGICSGLQDEIYRLRSVIESGRFSGSKNEPRDQDSADLIFSMYGIKGAGKATDSSDSTRVLPDKISSCDMTSCSPKSVCSSETVLKGVDLRGKHTNLNMKGNVIGKPRRKHERSRFVEKRNALALIEKKRKEKSKDIRLLSKGSSLSSKIGKQVSEPKSPKIKSVSFEKRKEVRNGDRQDCSVQGNEENDMDAESATSEKHKMVLNETFDLSEGDTSSNVLEAKVDDGIKGGSSVKNKAQSPNKTEKYSDGRHYRPKASDGKSIGASGKLKTKSGTVRVMSESRNEESEDLEDNAKGVRHRPDYGGNGNDAKRLAASMKSKELERLEEKDSDELHSNLELEDADVIAVGKDLSGIGHSTGEYDKEDAARGPYGFRFGNGPDAKCLNDVVNNDGAGLEARRHAAESPKSVIDDMDTIVMTDACRDGRKRTFPHHVLEVWDMPQTLASHDASKGYFVMDPKKKETTQSDEVTKSECVSSDNGIEKDPGLVKANDGCYDADEAYDLLLNKGLHKSSLKIKAKQRRRTLFPKVLPDECEIDSSKTKANLSADSKQTASTSPLAESSKLFAFDADSVKGIDELVHSKDDNILVCDGKDVVMADVLGSKANQTREIYNVTYDTRLRGLDSERLTETGVVSLEETNPREKAQVTNMEDDQESSSSSSEVLKLLNQVYIDPAAGKVKQKNVEKRAEHGLAAAQPGQHSRSQTEDTTVGDARPLGQAKQARKSPQRKSEREKSTREKASAGKGTDCANEIQRNRRGSSGGSDKCKNEMVGDVDYGQTLHTNDGYYTSGGRKIDDKVHDRTDEGAVDNDTVVIVDDAVLRDTRTSTPKKYSKDTGSSQSRMDRKNTTKGDNESSMKTNRSPRLSDVPDCLQSMPRLVPTEQSGSNSNNNNNNNKILRGHISRSEFPVCK